MYPAPFRYYRPTTLQDAFSLIARYAPDCAILAGGQSLIPLMNLRQATPGNLVDIGRVPGLSRMSFSHNVLSVGAMTRHQSFCEGEIDHLGLPGGFRRILKRIGSHIGNLPIRYRGTFGGSLALASPGSQWALLSVLLDADVLIGSTRGKRRERFGDVVKTSGQPWLRADEVILGADLNVPERDVEFGFAQVATSAGRPAKAFSLVAVERSNDHTCNWRIAIGACTPCSKRLHSLENELAGFPSIDLESTDFVGMVRRALAELPMIGGIEREYAQEIAAAAVTRAARQALAR